MSRYTRNQTLRSIVGRIVPLFALPLALFGCSESTTPTVPVEAPVLSGAPAPTPAQQELLQQVKGVTARFNSLPQAMAAGYQDPHHCVPGMGFHWINPSLIDDTFDPLQPEVMIYKAGPNGQLKLVAVEYIVIDVGQPRPDFAGYPFDINGTPVPVPHYSLHVWMYQDNPDGIFTNYNWTVSCPAGSH